MPFEIKHKCNVSDPEYADFGIAKSYFEGEEFSRARCEKCGEELVFISKGGFEEARVTTSIPGFILPGRRQ